MCKRTSLQASIPLYSQPSKILSMISTGRVRKVEEETDISYWIVRVVEN